ALRWLVIGLLGDPREAARRAAAREDLDAAAAEAVIRSVRCAISSPLVGAARRAPEAWAELPLAWSGSWDDLPRRAREALEAKLAKENRPSPEDPIPVEGVADLVYREGDGWRIVDYKTDAWSDGEELDRLEARYAPQLELYDAALLARFGAPVSAHLLFVAGERPVARRVV
ncbi:MAG: hypothetical protein D6718_13395, partial [Acidobacteria bacterium]